MTDSRSSLLIRHEHGPWRSPEIEAYKDEEMLKLMLRDSPGLLPFHVEGSVFVDELTVPLIGSVDLAGVDPDGGITLVECKLGANPEIRRSIIGQIFAYAAGLWQMSYEDFDRLFSARLQRNALADAIRAGLPQSASDWQEEPFRANVSANLQSGRFTLVIAVDRITDELKRIVPYVNSHTLAEVRFLAIEIGYVKDGDVEVIRPLTYGQESVSEKESVARRRTWTVEAYFEKLREYPKAEPFMNAIVEFSREHGAGLEGGSGVLPSLNARFPYGNEWRTVWSSFFETNGPSLNINFDYLRSAVKVEALAECARILRSIDGVRTKYVGLEPDFNMHRSLPIDPLLLQTNAIEIVERALLEVLPAIPTEVR